VTELTGTSAPAPAVVTPLDEHMGLDIARSLARKGVTVYGIDADRRAPGRHSNACRFVLGPSPEHGRELEYVEFLERFAQDLKVRPVLYPLSDLHVRVVSQYRERLLPLYRFVMPSAATVDSLLTKDGLAQAAASAGIPAPRTLPAATPAELEVAAETLQYPVILKPVDSTYWHSEAITKLLRHGLLAARAKVVLCRDRAALVHAHDLIAPADNRLVVQEVIPGEDSRLAYMAAYLGRDSQPLAVFAGRKLRVIPPGFGSASFVRTFHDPELERLGLALLQSMGWQGLVGVEFKKDSRDEQYKLIEVNARFGMWDGLSTVCGVDLPYIAYRDALELPVERLPSYRDNVIWLDWQRDVRAALAYRSRGELSMGAWIRSLRGDKMVAIYSREDWRPGAAFTWALVRRGWERLWGGASDHRGGS